MLWDMQPFASHWLLPEWPAPAGVQALCSTRSGGVSDGAYASLNLGLHVGDLPAQVERNRHILQTRIGVHPVFLDQVHGSTMLELDAGSGPYLAADGAFTRHSGLACTVMVADCLPVLFCDARGTRVAAAHAGWRGLLGQQRKGILEAAVASLGSTDVLAWLGPCIGPDAFEVGDEVRTAFVEDWPAAQACFQPGRTGKWWCNLQALARLRLQDLGVHRIFGNDGSLPWCTVSNPLRFFSHRRDGVSGRMAACIWRSA